MTIDSEPVVNLRIRTVATHHASHPPPSHLQLFTEQVIIIIVMINDHGATIIINISITMVSHPPTMPPSNSASDLPSAQVFHICPALNLTLDQIRKPFQRNETSFPIMYWDLHTTPLCKSSVYFYAEKSLWENPRSICCTRSQRSIESSKSSVIN